MHQWLDVFTTDLNMFEWAYVHASVNVPTFYSAFGSLLWQICILVRLSPPPGSTYPTHGVS